MSIVLPLPDKGSPVRRKGDSPDGKTVKSPRNKQDAESAAQQDGNLNNNDDTMNKPTLPPTPIPVVNISPRGSYHTTVPSKDEVDWGSKKKATSKVSPMPSPVVVKHVSEDADEDGRHTLPKRPKEMLPESPRAVVDVSEKYVSANKLASSTSRQWKSSEAILPENTVVKIQDPLQQHSLRTSATLDHKQRRKDVHSLPSNLGSTETEIMKSTLPATPPASIDIAKKPRLEADVSQAKVSSRSLSSEAKVTKDSVGAPPVAVIKLTDNKTKAKQSLKQTEQSFVSVAAATEKKEVKLLRNEISEESTDQFTSKNVLPPSLQPVVIMSKKTSSEDSTDLNVSKPTSIGKSSQRERVTLDTDSEKKLNDTISSHKYESRDDKDQTDIGMSERRGIIQKSPSLKVQSSDMKTDKRDGAEISKETKNVNKGEQNKGISDDINSKSKLGEKEKFVAKETDNDENSSSRRHPDQDDIETSVVNRLESAGLRRDVPLSVGRQTEAQKLNTTRISVNPDIGQMMNESFRRHSTNVYDRLYNVKDFGNSASLSRADLENKILPSIRGAKTNADIVVSAPETSTSLSKIPAADQNPKVNEKQPSDSKLSNVSDNKTGITESNSTAARLQEHILKFCDEMNPEPMGGVSYLPTKTETEIATTHHQGKPKTETETMATQNEGKLKEVLEIKTETATINSETKQKNVLGSETKETLKDDSPVSLSSTSEETKSEVLKQTENLSSMKKPITSSSNLKHEQNETSLNLGAKQLSAETRKSSGDSSGLKKPPTIRSVTDASAKTTVQTIGYISDSHTVSKNPEEKVIQKSSSETTEKNRSGFKDKKTTEVVKVNITKTDAAREERGFTKSNGTAKQPLQTIVDSDNKPYSENNITNSQKNSSVGSTITKTAIIEKTTSNNSSISDDTKENSDIVIGEIWHAEELSYDSWQETTAFKNESGFVAENETSIQQASKKSDTVRSEEENSLKDASSSKTKEPASGHYLLLFYRMLCHFLSRPEYPFHI